MKQRLTLIVTVLAVLALLSACDNMPFSDAEVQGLRMAPISEQNSADSPFPDGREHSDRMLIRTGQFQIEVEAVDGAIETVTEIITTLNGHIAGSRIFIDRNETKRASLTLQVPAENYDQAVDRLRELGTVDDESTGTEDITRKYVDLVTRLNVKREAEARLREILKTQTADVSQVLEVEREINRLVEEIERIEGQRRHFQQQVTMSTLSLELYEPGSRARSGPIIRALKRSLEVLSESVAALIFLVVFVLPWMLLAAIGWWIVGRIRRSHRRKPPAS